VLDFLHRERSAGRQILLVTAANEQIASGIAGHVGVFDEVLASDPERNLRGSEKGRALVERFGRGGFVYAGNDHTDLDVWPLGAAAICVNAPSGVRAALPEAHIEREFPPQEDPLLAALLLPRHYLPYWARNALAFLPWALAGSATGGAGWMHAVWLFLVLGAMSTALWIFNDLCDLEDDRRAEPTGPGVPHSIRDPLEHPGGSAGRPPGGGSNRKHMRPLAEGTTPLWAGFAWSLVLGAASLAAAAFTGLLLPLLALVAALVTYTLWARWRPAAATLALAGAHLARFGCGAIVVGIPLGLSGWSAGTVVSLLLAWAARALMPFLDET